MIDSNREQLIAAAGLLGPLLDDLVFVGGAVTGLLITDPAAAPPRPTLDVDVIAEITSYAAYSDFGDRLRKLGFHEDTRTGSPLCRWVQREITLDVMPLDEAILGFSNRWYRAAMNAAVPIRIAEDSLVRVITAPYFVATKIEAFKSRGRRDFQASRDLEDVICIVDGRAELIEEVGDQEPELRAYLAGELRRLVKDARFIDSLPGHLLPDAVSQSRLEIILRRLEELAGVS